MKLLGGAGISTQAVFALTIVRPCLSGDQSWGLLSPQEMGKTLGILNSQAEQALKAYFQFLVFLKCQWLRSPPTGQQCLWKLLSGLLEWKMWGPCEAVRMGIGM